MWLLNWKIFILIFFVTSSEASGSKSRESNFLRDHYNGGRPLNVEYYLRDFKISDDFSSLTNSSYFSQQFRNEWENIERNLSSEAIDTICYKQLATLVRGLASKDLTSIKYFDSWGKIPTGILKGNRYELGNFDECLDIRKSMINSSDIVGKYCLAEIPFGQYFNKSDFGELFSINVGVCMPEECSAEEFDVFLSKFLQLVTNSSVLFNPDTNPLVQRPSCQVKIKEPFGALQWSAIFVLILLGTALLFSTSYEYVTRLTGEPGNPLLKSFSLITNMEQLLKIIPNEKTPNVIHCLNGIRCLSLIWVIIGHSYMYTMMAPNINMLDFLPWRSTAYSMLFQYAVFSVDTFFFLSGLLVAYITFKEMEKNNGYLNVPLMYFHRIVRLTPMLALAVLSFTALYHYMGNGPLWNAYEFLDSTCSKNWWSTLLYIQNYVNVRETCLGHTWYLAVDTQLYILSPIFLIALWRWGWRAAGGITVLGLLLAGCLFATIMINKLSFHIMGTTLPVGDAMFKTYFATHLRASPWLIGLIFGYFLYKRRGTRTIIPKVGLVIGWLVSLGLIASLLFGFYPKHQDNAPPVTTLEEAFFWTLGRIAWPLALCWLVFACFNGYGGIINEFLSAPFWQPLSRLSYTMYIWHMFIEGMTAGRTKTNTYFSNFSMTLTFWGDFGWTLLLSVIMYLAVEAPLAQIEKKLLSRSKRRPASPSSSQRNLVESQEKI